MLGRSCDDVLCSAKAPCVIRDMTVFMHQVRLTGCKKRIRPCSLLDREQFTRPWALIKHLSSRLCYHHPQLRPISSLQPVYLIANTMMFMRTVLALSLAAFSLAVPVAQPQANSLGEDVGAFCFSQYAFHKPD